MTIPEDFYSIKHMDKIIELPDNDERRALLNEHFRTGAIVFDLNARIFTWKQQIKQAEDSKNHLN